MNLFDQSKKTDDQSKFKTLKNPFFQTCIKVVLPDPAIPMTMQTVGFFVCDLSCSILFIVFIKQEQTALSSTFTKKKKKNETKMPDPTSLVLNLVGQAIMGTYHLIVI